MIDPNYSIPLITSLWSGIITSLSPCPLVSNLSAVVYISTKSRSAMLYGITYSLGRAFLYLLVGIIVVKTTLSVERFSFFISKYGSQFVAIVLVVSGMYINGMIGKGFGGFSFVDLGKVKINKGLFSSFLLGFILSLSFCPISAALYFGVVIPLSIAKNSFFIPFIYGIGTALPVVVISVLLSITQRKVFYLVAKIESLDRYLRAITGWVFIVAGIYLALRYIFQVI